MADRVILTSTRLCGQRVRVTPRAGYGTRIYWQYIHLSGSCQDASTLTNLLERLKIQQKPVKMSLRMCSSRGHHNLCLAFSTFFRSRSTTPDRKFAFETRLKPSYFIAVVKSNRVKTGLRQDASSGALRGRLRRDPLTSRGDGSCRGFATTRPLFGSSFLAADGARMPCPG